MDACDTRSSSTIMLSPPCAVMACSSAAALAAFRVVSTTKKPSLANFWAMAPPTPQRMPTGRSLSSSTFPCASWVLRPSACHLEVAPTTTATCLRVESITGSLSLEVDCLPWPKGNTATYTMGRNQKEPHLSQRPDTIGASHRHRASEEPQARLDTVASSPPSRWRGGCQVGRGSPSSYKQGHGGAVERRLTTRLSGRRSRVDAPGGSRARDVPPRGSGPSV